MKKQTRSILQELNNLAITSDKDRLIESTANNICLLYTSDAADE